MSFNDRYIKLFHKISNCITKSRILSYCWIGLSEISLQQYMYTWSIIIFCCPSFCSQWSCLFYNTILKYYKMIVYIWSRISLIKMSTYPPRHTCFMSFLMMLRNSFDIYFISSTMMYYYSVKVNNSRSFSLFIKRGINFYNRFFCGICLSEETKL